MSSHPIISRLAVCILIISCDGQKQEKNLFENGEPLGVNKNGNLEEVSGLAASATNPGHLWAHNDSGHPAKLFLLDTMAKTKKVFTLLNSGNRDWEDIALGPGPDENSSYLYVGDIGDNLSRYDVKYIYRLPEPRLDQNKEINDVDIMAVILSGGEQDTEALMSDPVSHNLYLISKRGDAAGIYEITNPFASDTVVAQKQGAIPYTHITAGDISPDGKEVLMKNYKNIYYWKKKGNETIPELLKTPAAELPYDRENQGEAIAWARDGSGFYTLGENARGERARLFFYKRK